MKHPFATTAALCLLIYLTGCGQQAQTAPFYGEVSAANTQAVPAESTDPSAGHVQTAPSPESTSEAAGQISKEDALAVALDNADVPEQDAYNIKNEQDSDNGIPIYDIEFETDYGDYDFEIAIADGRIVGADYEVDEEYLEFLGSSGISPEGAQALVAEKVPGSRASDVQVREEREDGRGRFEGKLYFEGMLYEFEIDPATGRIFDWNADLRDLE